MRWTGSEWLLMGQELSYDCFQQGAVTTITEYNGDVVVGGLFFCATGGDFDCLARWNGTDWAPIPENSWEVVFKLLVYNGDLIVAGGYGGRNIARWNGSEW